MGLIAGFLAANIFGKIAFVVLLIAEVLNWLVFAMNDWGRFDRNVVNNDDKYGVGVWRICGNQEPDPNCSDLDGWRLAWFGAFQGFAIFGFMGVTLAFFFMILLLFVPQCIGNRDIGIVCGVSAFVATVCYTVSLILFGVKFDRTYDFGYDREALRASFYLAIIVAILALVAGICAIIGIRGGRQVGSSSPKTGSGYQDDRQQRSRQQRRRKDEEQGQEEEQQQQKS